MHWGDHGKVPPRQHPEEHGNWRYSASNPPPQVCRYSQCVWHKIHAAVLCPDTQTLTHRCEGHLLPSPRQRRRADKFDRWQFICPSCSSSQDVVSSAAHHHSSTHTYGTCTCAHPVSRPGPDASKSPMRLSVTTNRRSFQWLAGSAVSYLQCTWLASVCREIPMFWLSFPPYPPAPSQTIHAKNRCYASPSSLRTPSFSKRPLPSRNGRSRFHTVHMTSRVDTRVHTASGAMCISNTSRSCGSSKKRNLVEWSVGAWTNIQERLSLQLSCSCILQATVFE